MLRKADCGSLQDFRGLILKGKALACVSWLAYAISKSLVEPQNQ